MMVCGGCRQRQQQIGAAVQALVKGDVNTASVNLHQVVQSSVADAGAAARIVQKQIAAAHARLKR